MRSRWNRWIGASSVSVARNQVGLEKMSSTKEESPVLLSLYVTTAISLVLSGIFWGEPFLHGHPKRCMQIISYRQATPTKRSRVVYARAPQQLMLVVCRNRRPRVFVWVEVYSPNKSIRLRQRGGPTPRTPETIMNTEPLRVPNGETYREKALRKFKQQPLVPLGSSSPTWGGST